MRWGTPDHPKMSHFCSLAGIGVAQAVGHLELLWHWAAKYRANGSLEGLSDASIAAACRWTGDVSPFVRALEAARWIDVAPVRRIHDWSEHAEKTVHTILANAGMLFCDGTMPSVNGLDSKYRERALRRLEAVKAEFDAEASHPAGPEAPRSLHGVSKEFPRLAVALAVAVSNGTNTTTAPPTPVQRSLPIGPTGIPPKPPQPTENVQALTRNIEELAERLGEPFDRVALYVTSGEVNGRRVCKGTLSFDTMSDKHMRRSIIDSNNALRRQSA